VNPTLVAARAGLSRGRIEFKQTMTTPGDLVSFLLLTGGLLTEVIRNRQSHVAGTQFSLSTVVLAGVLGLDVGMYGVLFMADRLVADRQDGTLLRAKAIPNGMLGYLIGKVVNHSVQITCAVLITLFVGAFLVTGLAIGGVGNWLTLALVLVFGLLATLPVGAVLGSLIPDTRSTSLILLLLAGLAAISGIFEPITRLPAFLQWIGQAFPLYWLGLGMRSALLPHSMAAAEIGHSWRHLATFGVLSAWAIAGLVLAPVMLRRMARRESGSSVAARREKEMRRL
jgi:ABC-2 type transport system permease protein